MPPRWLSILIVAIWLLVSGRLLVLDLLPRLLPGQPPPFTIDLVEEARLRRVFTDWIVLKGDQRLFKARTQVLHPEYNVFDLTAEFTPVVKGNRVAMHGMLIRAMTSCYRVTGNGDLLGVSVKVEGEPQLAGAIRLLGQADVRIDIEGEVHQQQFKPLLRFSHGKQRPIELSLPAVRIHQGGSVLLPLHPVNRLQGISPGQHWQMTVLDPLGDSLTALVGGGGELRLLQARVRSEVILFNTSHRRDVPCLVIDYEGDDLKASTWVEQATGFVMSQEATFGNETWVMVRE